MSLALEKPSIRARYGPFCQSSGLKIGGFGRRASGYSRQQARLFRNVIVAFLATRIPVDNWLRTEYNPHPERECAGSQDPAALIKAGPSQIPPRVATDPVLPCMPICFLPPGPCASRPSNAN